MPAFTPALHAGTPSACTAPPLRDESGGPLPDAITASAPAGQRLMLHTADGDAAYSLSDAAGRPLWARSAQGTVTECGFELPQVTYDNAGAAAVLSVSLTGQPLASEQRLLPADAPPPDWSTAPRRTRRRR